MLEGASYEQEGHRARALESWKSVAHIQPGPEAWFKVASLYESMHQLDAAARAVREGLRLLPAEKRADGEAWAVRLETAERQRMENRRRERLGDEDERDQLLRLLGSDEDARMAGDEGL
jgi:tetratricopeptide (TPR) repeat protein